MKMWLEGIHSRLAEDQEKMSKPIKEWDIGSNWGSSSCSSNKEKE